MADPTKPVIDYSYTGFQQANQDNPFPGTQLDNDLQKLSRSDASIIDALKQIRRSDGALQNGIVTVDSLAESLTLGFTMRGDWVLGTSYNAADGVVYDGIFYRALVSNTATSTNRPDVSPSTWEFLFTVAETAGLAAVATTGAYADLSGKPTLGSAAAQSATAFATAAQGSLAESSVQPPDLNYVTLQQLAVVGTATQNTAAALLAISSGRPIHLGTKDWVFNDNLTFSQPVISDGGAITSPGKTLTFQGGLVAPRKQMFYSGTTYAGVQSAPSEWFLGSYAAGGVNAGTTATAALTLFFAALSAGLVEPRLPDATYLVTDGFSVSETIGLKGTKRAHIRNTNPALNKPIIDLTGNAASGSLLEGFRISSAVAVSSANAVGVRVGLGQNIHLDKLEISDLYSGIKITADQSGAWVTDNFVHNTVSHGFDIDAPNLTVRGNYAIYCGYGGTTGDGFHYTALTGGSGGLIHECNTAFMSGRHNHNFQGNTTYGMGDLYVFGNVSSFSPNGRGFNVDTYSKNIIFSHNFTEGAGMTSVGGSSVVTTQNGIHFTKNNHGVTIIGSQATFSSANGMSINCPFFKCSACDLTGNNTGGAAQYSGLMIGEEGSACTDFVVTAVKTTHQAGTDVFYQQYGINLFGSGHSGIITACVLEGVIGPLNGYGGGNANVEVSHCKGFKTENKGVATIAVGASSVTVTHGLGIAPVHVSPTPIGTNQVDQLWWGAPLAATFVLNVGANITGSPITISWEAKG